MNDNKKDNDKNQNKSKENSRIDLDSLKNVNGGVGLVVDKETVIGKDNKIKK